jgi:hypothetical protein
VHLVETNSSAQYAEPGYLLYVKDKALMAHPFDAQHGTLVGEPVSVAMSVVLGGVVFSASTTRTLMYRPTSTTNELVWVDRQGIEPVSPRRSPPTTPSRSLPMGNASHSTGTVRRTRTSGSMTSSASFHPDSRRRDR